MSELCSSSAAAIAAIGIGVAGRAIAVDQHGPEHPLAEEPPEPALEPVVGAGDRPRSPPQRRRQHRPDQHEVGVAPVIGEVDASGPGAERTRATPRARP